jgi:hypothetical protein
MRASCCFGSYASPKEMRASPISARSPLPRRAGLLSQGESNGFPCWSAKRRAYRGTVSPSAHTPRSPPSPSRRAMTPSWRTSADRSSVVQTLTCSIWRGSDWCRRCINTCAATALDFPTKTSRTISLTPLRACIDRTPFTNQTSSRCWRIGSQRSDHEPPPEARCPEEAWFGIAPE